MSDKSNGTRGGISFCGMLFIAFLVLKLCGVIAWSWVWVFAPLWIPAVIAIFVFIIVIIFVFERI